MSVKRVLLQTPKVLGVLVAVLVGSVLLDQIPASAARPPKNLKTIEQFRTWKKDAIRGKGTFEHSGVTYTVMLAPAGRYLASGPSAYLFDRNGQFVDWTADMGDFRTAKHRFNLTGGQVTSIEHEKPQPTAVSAPIASWFQIGHLGRRVTE